VSETVAFESHAWGPAHISHEDLELLSEFTGLSRSACVERLRSYHPWEMATAWRAQNPTTPEEIRAFYSATDLYVWELLAWNSSRAYEPYLRALNYLAERWPAERYRQALDYGSGIGTAALVLAERGYQLTLADVPGRTLDFARMRLARRGVEHDVIEVVDDVPRLPAEAWDVLVCFDVLEHVPDPAGLGRALVRAIAPGTGMAIAAAFDTPDDEWPHHLGAASKRFRGHRWWFYFQSLGTAKVAEHVYRRLGEREAIVRRLQYQLWRATGLRVEGFPR
jgi:2-polyprenyl-3-methyl-5-hydroxy-6-metoxy-1,4-benzoquinol methylase